jgi:hypothetical protein
MESFEVIPQVLDARVATIMDRLNAAAKERAVVAVVAKDVDGDKESFRVQNTSSPQADISQSCPTCPDALLEFCKELKPCYSSTLNQAKAHGAPRFSQRDMERSVQGQQIANNRQHRYERKMRHFVNPLTRVEISQHKILDRPDESSVIVVEYQF